MAFVAEAALIALREGLEAFLIAGILIGLVVKLGRPDARIWVWGGFAAGAAASLIIGLLVQVFLLDTFEANGGGAWFELVAALAAVGVLTYMVFWMWKHTRTLMGSLRQKVGQALASNTLWVIAFLTFVSVLREGLEVVLFYAALSSGNSGFDLAWSGFLGVLASLGLVWLILRTTISFNLAKFFAVTGVLLVFVAAGLLVHSVTAATEIGLLSPQAAIWDTSAALTDDSAVGRVLHALFGYTAAPSLLQALLYFGYLFGVGITYLWSLGTYHDHEKGSYRRVPVIATAAILLLASVATAWGGANPTDTLAGGDHGHEGNAMAAGLPHEAFILELAERMKTYEGKVGILIRDHGEMVEYNASTYESLKQFIRDIWPYTGLPAQALDADQGTFFLDEANPFASQPQTDPTLVDAWTAPWDLPAAPAGDYANQGVLDDFCQHQPQFYFVPGPAGPGWGEGDLLEILGLCTYRDWLKMENHSPRYEQGLLGWEYLTSHLEGHFGDKIALAFAHGVDPKVSALETMENAAQMLVDAGATVVLDVYQSSIFSDAMNTCMMAPHAEHALREAGYKGKILPVASAGTHALWGEAIMEYVTELLADVPAQEKVTIHLVQHGAEPGSDNPCEAGDAVDQYDANAQTQYKIGEAALKAAFPALTVRQVYGQGAGAAEDGVLSPTEALALDRAGGVQRAIMIPYEFWGDAVDNLVYFRESLGFTPDDAPYYAEGYRTELDYQGLPVLVPSAEFSTYTKCDALLAQISVVLDGLAPAAEVDA